MIEVTPIAMTHVDWKTFNEVCQSSIGVRPTKGLDDVGIKLIEPAAFLASLNMQNNPLEVLRADPFLEQSFEHVTLSFFVRADEITFYKLRMMTYLSIMNISTVAVLSGTVRDWYHASLCCCLRSATVEVRDVLTKVVTILNQTKLCNIWSSHDIKKLEDGTIVIE